MRKAIIFVALGLILLGLAAWLIFPNVRSDLIQHLPFFKREPDAVTLRYWGLWEPREVIQPLLNKYQEEHPNITIEYEERDASDYLDRLSSRLGIEGGPDIVRVHSTWLPTMYSKLAPMPDSVMSTADYEKIFYPVNAVFAKHNDAYYGIPLMVDGLALVYNKDLFARAGIDIPPTNWEEFRTDVKLLTTRDSQGQIAQSGAALGYAKNIEYFEDIVGLMMAQNGVKFVDKDGKVAFHKSISPIGGNLGVEAMRFYSLFATTEQSWNPNWGNSTDEFAAGRVAMVFLPSHRILEVLSKQPKFSIGVVPVPQLPGANQNKIAWGNYWIESVSKTASNPEEAWKFLKWLSEKEQLTSMYAIARNIRAFGEPYSRRDLASALNADVYTLPYVNQGEIYTTWFFTDGVKNSNLNDPIKAALSEMVEAIATGSNIEGALGTAANTVQLVLDNNLE